MSDKVSNGFQWLENDQTGNPSGLRRPRDGAVFPLDVMAVQSLVSGGGNLLVKAGAGSRTSPLHIACFGDSITANASLFSPLEYTGFEKGLYATALTVTNLTASFLPMAYATANCAQADTVVLAFDGVKNLTVNIASEGVGAAVDVTNGGFFHVVSAGGTKGVLVAVRWANRPGAVSDTTSSSLGNIKRQNLLLGTWCAPALARLGVHQYKLRNWGISGDTSTDALARLPQMLATAPDIVLMMIGINDYSAAGTATRIASMVSLCNAAGAHVFICTTFPPNSSTSTLASQYANLVRQLILLERNSAYQVTVFDGASLMLDPAVQTGNGILPAAYYASGNIHPYMTATVALGGPVAGALSKLLPYVRPKLSSVMDVYDATNNPQGNLLGTSGQFLGTAGTLNSGGATITATGTLATSWIEGELTASTGATVVYTAPAAGSPIARTADSSGYALPGNVQRVVVTNSSSPSNSCRRATYRSSISGLTAGMRVRVHLAVRLTSATRMDRFDAYVQFGVSSGPYTQVFLTEMNNGATMDTSGTGSIADSGWLYLSSDAVVVPALYNAGTLQINHGCAANGGYTLDMQDAFVEILS